LTHLELCNVSIEFPLYQSTSRSLKRELLRAAVGGTIGQDSAKDRLAVRGLQAISLSLHAGDRLALVGHNGAGKTTMLRAMAGIYYPSQGKVLREGSLVPLFDIHAGFDDEATGYENIMLRGLLMGHVRADIERRMDSIAEFSGLGDFLDLPVRTYSDGMMVRLLFSIATSCPAEILLMDEWIAAGDLDFIEKADKRLRDYVDQAQILVLASHNPQLLRAICNRAIMLEGGRIALSGSVDQVLHAYSSRGSP
jgi:lipopolysaccharide transport system ATP-binding protein